MGKDFGITDCSLPLNREDMTVIFHMLSDKGMVSKKILSEFFMDPDKFCKRPFTAHIKEAWNETATKTPLETIYQKIISYAHSHDIDLESIFKSNDSSQTGMLTFEQFAKACGEAMLPVTTENLRAVYESLQYSLDNKIDYTDFLQRINAPLDNGERMKPMQNERVKAELKNKWEVKAKAIFVKYKEMLEKQENWGKEKRALEYKIETVSKDPKQKQILELQRKIEVLENLVRERDAYMRKTLGNSGNLEMNIMKKNLELEKAELLQVIANKNKEIMMFKNELDSVLEVMQKLKKKKPTLQAQ